MSCNFSYRFFVTVVIYVILRVYVAKKFTLTLTLLLFVRELLDLSIAVNLFAFVHKIIS